MEKRGGGVLVYCKRLLGEARKVQRLRARVSGAGSELGPARCEAAERGLCDMLSILLNWRTSAGISAILTEDFRPCPQSNQPNCK
jgi:hypothetical protein